MNAEALCWHTFQFVAFCPVFHEQAIGISKFHINEDCHLLHITRGTGALFVEENKYVLQPGAVVSIPPFARFYFKLSTPFEMLNIHYRIWLANGDAMEEHTALPLVFKPRYFNVMLPLLRAMQQSVPENMGMAAMAHEIVLRHLAANELTETRHPVINARLMNACRQMSLPGCVSFEAQAMARSCGVSVSQMNRLFKQSFRLTPHRFWEKKRFEELCRQLRFTDLPASKIAARFGMEDNAYFSRWFKKMAGCTPSDFRRRNI